jgi:multidrug efflux system outer membrane protein
VTTATAESIANLPWWELLKDPELQRLVRMAVEENLDLQIAAANIEEFRAQLMIAKFDLVPSLDYSGTAFGYRNTNNNVFPVGPGAVPLGGKNDGLSLSHESADVGLKWEVDLWGRIRRSIEAARAQLLSKSENQRAVILGLVSNVAEAYFNLRGLDYEVEITKRTLKSWEETVRLSELRFKQGVIPKLDLDRFQAERAGLRRSWQISSGKSSKKKTGSASCLAADRRRLQEGSASPSNRFLLPSRQDSRRIFFNGDRTS